MKSLSEESIQEKLKLFAWKACILRSVDKDFMDIRRWLPENDIESKSTAAARLIYILILSLVLI